MAIKSRLLDGGYCLVQEIAYVSGKPPQLLAESVKRTAGWQYTVSSGNPFRLLGKVPYDIGSTFDTVKWEWTPKQVNGRTYNTYTPESSVNYRVHTGTVMAAFDNTTTASPSFLPAAVSNAVLVGAGTKGVAMALPNSPMIDLATFIGEMRDLPKFYSPAKWKAALKNLRKLPRRTAEDYLNFEFGWKPLISEILDFHKATEKADQRLNSFVKNSGKRIRRRRTVLSTSSTTTSSEVGSTVYPSPPLAVDYWQNPTAVGTRTKVVQANTEATFSGCFTYYLPPVNTEFQRDKRRKRLRRYLTGLEVNPDVLWNLAPWSWAADWIGNMGSIMKNLSYFTQDGLVMNYGYITYVQHGTATYTYEGKKLKNGPAILPQVCTYKRIQRVRATPFGFGLNPGSFSTRQWAIIGALGITKAPRSLTF